MTLAHVAHAAVDANAFGNAINPIITNIVSPLVGLAFAVAIIVFVYGVFQVVWGGEESRDRGKKSIFGGLIGMFIMMSAWGIIYIVANTVMEIGK